MDELQQAADGLLDGVLIPAAQGPAERHAALEHRRPALTPQPRPTFAEEVADQAEVIGLDRFADLGHVPAGQVGMDAVHEGRVVAHLRRHRAEQMADALLVLDVDLEIAHHDDAAVGADALLAPAELARLHVALHDIDAILLVEGDAGHFVEADHIVLADQPPLAGRHVDEHPGDGALAAADQVGIGRDLLKEMALAGAARAQLDHIVVVLDERHHAQQQHIALALGHLRRLKADAAQQKLFPLVRREPGAALRTGPPARRAWRVGSDAARRSQTGGHFSLGR